MKPTKIIKYISLTATFILSTIGFNTAVSAQDLRVSLDGIIDFHAHAGPDSRPRSLNDIDAARQARQAGLRGIVLKNHFTMTADRAAIAMSQVEGLEIFGGIALNRAVGGINPEAVRQMVAFDGGRGKVVWLPTFDSEFYVRRDGGSDPELFVPVLENGTPVDGLLEVFELVAEHDLVLAMGHSSPIEVLALIPIAQSLGVQHILVTHVFGQSATRQQMQAMAEQGAIMELDWLAVHNGSLSIDDYVRAIENIGAQHFLISTDFGQAENPSHGVGMAAFIRALQDADVTAAQLDTMARVNPASLLGLD